MSTPRLFLVYWRSLSWKLKRDTLGERTTIQLILLVEVAVRHCQDGGRGVFAEARNDDLSQKPHDTLAREAGAEQQRTPLPIAPLFHSLERTRRAQRQETEILGTQGSGRGLSLQL